MSTDSFIADLQDALRRAIDERDRLAAEVARLKVALENARLDAVTRSLGDHRSVDPPRSGPY